MADDTLQDEVRKAIENQIGELREQIAHINRSLSDHGIDIDEIRHEAGEALEGAARSVRKAARHAQEEATAIAEVARENPAATTTVLTAVGLIGFAIGYAVANAERAKRWW